MLATAGGKTQQEVPAPPKCVQGKAPLDGALPCTHLGVIKRAPPCSRRLGLEGPDVARALVRVVRSLVASLVRLRTQSQRDVINGRAAFEQGHRLSRPAIAGQGAQLGVGLQARRACDTPSTGEVVAVVDVGAASAEAVATRVGEDAPADAHRAGDVFQATAGVVGDSAVADRHPAPPEIEAAAIAAGVIGDSAVADRHRAFLAVEAAAPLGSGVVGEGAAGDAHRAEVLEAAAIAGGRVVGEGAVADAHRAEVLEAAALAVGGRAMSNGESVEGQAAAAIHGEHLQAAPAVEGDALPAAGQGHAPGDAERAGELDIAAAGEGDDIAGVVAVSLGDIGLQLGVRTTIADGESTLGMRRTGQPAQHDAQAEEQGQPAQQAQPRRETSRVWMGHKMGSFLPLFAETVDRSRAGRPAVGPCLLARTGTWHDDR